MSESIPPPPSAFRSALLQQQRPAATTTGNTNGEEDDNETEGLGFHTTTTTQAKQRMDNHEMHNLSNGGCPVNSNDNTAAATRSSRYHDEAHQYEVALETEICDYDNNEIGDLLFLGENENNGEDSFPMIMEDDDFLRRNHPAGFVGTGTSSTSVASTSPLCRKICSCCSSVSGCWFSCWCWCCGWCCWKHDESSWCVGVLRRGYHASLAASPTTPVIARIGIPLLILFNHILFYHGQAAHMWQLVSRVHMDLWYNATSLEAKSVFHWAGIGQDNKIHVFVNDTNIIQIFTYSTAIHELWDAAGMETSISVWLPRLASISLILLSGVWPHLKLFLLNVYWTVRPNSPRVFYWLASLGKWSLSDVLVVCVMLGILHMDWIMDPDMILQGVIHQSPTIMKILPELYNVSEICNYLLDRRCPERRLYDDSSSTEPLFASHPLWNDHHVTNATLNGSEPFPLIAASHPFLHDNPHANETSSSLLLEWDFGCSACQQFVTSSLAHPLTFQSTLRGISEGIRTSGGGAATLRVQGLMGIYTFCAAVVLSILLSCLIDLYSVQSSSSSVRAQQQQRNDGSTETGAGAGSHNNVHNDRNRSRISSCELPPCRSRISSCERPLIDDDDHREDAALALESPPPRSICIYPDHHDVMSTSMVIVDGAPAVDTDPESSFVQSTSIPTQSALSVSSTSSTSRSSTSSTPPKSCQSFLHSSALMFSLITAGIVWRSMGVPTIRREVVGVGPHWLHQVTGIQWNTVYSLQSLTALIGEAGKYDRLLQWTFGWFCVVGPALRAGLCVVALGCGSHHHTTSASGAKMVSVLLPLIECVGAFCALDVLLVVTYLVHLLLPSTTATIVDLPQCALIANTTTTDENHHDDSGGDVGNSTTNASSGACFQVFLEPDAESFPLLGLGTILLLFAAQWSGWILAKKVQRLNRLLRNNRAR